MNTKRVSGFGRAEVGLQPDSGRVGGGRAHSARPRLSSRLSLSLPVCLRTALDDRWRCIHSFLITCPDIRAGKETHCRLFAESARWVARMGSPWHQLPAEYSKWNLVYRR